MIGTMTYVFSLSFLGFVLMAQASSLGDIWPNINAPENTVEELDDILKPVKTNVRIKDLNAKQQNLFFNSRPKMLEKTKILKRVRKLKDQGEERTKVIYRTRIIGLVDPKPKSGKSQGSDFNYFNLGDNIFEWPIESDEDEDYSDIMTSPKVKSEDEKVKKMEMKNSAQNEMPKNKHSSKKELRNNLITVKSVENSYNPREDRIDNLQTIETFDPKIKPTPSVFKKVHFDDEDEVDTKTKPVSAFRKINFVDSLELYRNEQLKKQQAQTQQGTNTQGTQTQQEQTLNTKINQPHPKLQRQFSFYGRPNKNENTFSINTNTNERKPDISITKPAIEQQANTIILLPTKNNINQADLKENINQNSYPSLDKTLKPIQQEVDNTNTVKPDWIGDLLIKKVAQAQAAQAKVAQQHMQAIHQQQKLAS